jgi:drug/metabolite transporter (DMT)-like permease
MRSSPFKKIISPALLVLAALIWGFAFSAQKAAETVPVFTTGVSRSLFATVFLMITVMVFDKINHTGRHLFSKKKIIDLTKYEIIGGSICGTILALATFFQQTGINGGTDAGKASFITALYVVLVPIYALAMKRKAPINVWISIAIAVVGFYLLCITGDFTMVPSDVFVLISSLIFPVHILAIDHFSPKCDGIRMSMVQFFACSIVNLIFAVILEWGTPVAVVFDAILPLLFLGIGSSGIAYTLQIIGQKGINPAAASILMSLESVFGVLGSALLLSEKMSPREYLGCGVVFFAVILSQLNFSKIIKKRNKETQNG